MKWFRLNYTDQIVKSVVKSTFAKKKLNILVMMLATVLIRSILCSLFCLIISYNIYIDFFLHAIISICLILKSHWIYDIVETKQKEFYNMITELGNEVDWGGVTPEVAMVNLAETFGQRFNQPWVANAKLQEIAWLYAFLSTCKTQKQRNQFVTDIIFLAAKEGKDFNTRYGPFGKIY